MSLIMSEVDDFLNMSKSFFKCFLPCELPIKHITRFRRVGLWSTLPTLLIVFMQTFSVFIKFFINPFFYDFMSLKKKAKGLPHLSWTHLWGQHYSYPSYLSETLYFLLETDYFQEMCPLCDSGCSLASSVFLNHTRSKRIFCLPDTFLPSQVPFSDMVLFRGAYRTLRKFIFAEIHQY